MAERERLLIALEGVLRDFLKVRQELVERGYRVVIAVDVAMVEKDDLDEHLAYTTEHKLVLLRISCQTFV